MQITEQVVYVGANVYAYYPVIRLGVDLGELEYWPSARLGPRFIDPLLEALPGLVTHGCSWRAPGGFVRRLREDEGTWMGHILEHVALELQQLAGARVTFGKTRSTGRAGEYFVVYAYEHETVGVRAGELAYRLLCSLLPPDLVPDGGRRDGDLVLREEIADLIALAQRARLARAEAAATSTSAERMIVVAGERDTDEVALRLAERLASAGRRVGVAGSFGARAGTAVLADPSAAGAPAEQAVIHSGVDVAVLATTRRRLLDSGLGLRRCEVAAVIGAIDGESDPLHLPLEIADRSAVLPGEPPAALAAATIAALVDRS